MLENIFHVIRENSGWIFGSSSLAAILLAFIQRSGKKKDTDKKTASAGKVTASTSAFDGRHLFVLLIVIAVLSGTISISDVFITSVNTGDNSTVITGTGNAQINATVGKDN